MLLWQDTRGMGGAVHASKDEPEEEEDAANKPTATFSRLKTLAKPKAVKKLIKPTSSKPLTMLGFSTSAPRDKLVVVAEEEEAKAKDAGSTCVAVVNVFCTLQLFCCVAVVNVFCTLQLLCCVGVVDVFCTLQLFCCVSVVDVFCTLPLFCCVGVARVLCVTSR